MLLLPSLCSNKTRPVCVSLQEPSGVYVGGEDVQIDSSLRELEKDLLNEVSFHVNATSAVAWYVQLSREENSNNTEKEQYRAI